ncbi:MAG: hypothetical protein ACYC1P_03595 [Gaiellaceae bacterium]
MPRVEPQQLELEVMGLDLTQPTDREDPRQRPEAEPRPGTASVGSAPGLPRPERKADLPRLALTFAESAVMLGVSDEFFAQHVACELRFVRRGRKKLVALRELERWLTDSATRDLH